MIPTDSTSPRWPRLIATTLTLSLLGLAACGDADVRDGNNGGNGGNGDISTGEQSTGGGSGDGSGVNNGSAGEHAGEGGDYSAPAPSASGGGGDGGGTNNATNNAPDPGQLTAGEWRDNEHFDYWLELMNPTEADATSYAEHVEGWGLRLERRIVAEVTHGDAPAADVAVRAVDAGGNVVYEARTDNAGRAYLFPGWIDAQPSTGPITVEAGPAGSAVASDPVADAPDSLVELTLSEHAAPIRQLDLLFAIDVTGSMMDEQDYLRAEMGDVIARVAASDSALKIRASFNFYCDPSDQFGVVSNPFTADIEAALAILQEGESCGGGDYPEAVDEGLEDAIEGHTWRESAQARLLFVVLDAPPHTDEEGLQRLRDAADSAARKGIRIIPILSSGGDKPTEFLLRSLALGTGGTYTFLTDHSGIGDAHIEPTVGQYEVEHLNDLLVRLIVAYTE